MQVEVRRFVLIRGIDANLGMHTNGHTATALANRDVTFARTEFSRHAYTQRSPKKLCLAPQSMEMALGRRKEPESKMVAKNDLIACLFACLVVPCTVST